MELKLHQPHDAEGQATEAPARLLSKKKKKKKLKCCLYAARHKAMMSGMICPSAYDMNPA